jgi:adenosine deaminase
MLEFVIIRASMADWFERVPKVEIHLHLEGAIPHEALWELVRKYGGDRTVPSFEVLKSRFEYWSFAHFIEIWDWKNRFLREYDDFTFVTEAVARDLARQKVLYVEAFFSPSDFARHGLKTQRLAEAIRAGLSRVPDVHVALVADLVRNSGPERAAITLSEVNEVRHQGVIGIGIGGSEQDFPPKIFEKVFEQARRLGFRTSAHAGEAAGAESVREAVRSLRVDRIGHGTRAQEDDSLLDLLADRQIPLEMCPLSNLRTGVVPTMARHPIRKYFDRGLVVTVNTDDPKMFGNSLAQEYRCLEAELGFSREEIRSLILQGVKATWLPEDSKRQLSESCRRDPACRE